MKPPKHGYYWITTVYRNGEILLGYFGIEGWQTLPWEGIPNILGNLEDDDVTWHSDKELEAQYPPEEAGG